MVSTCINADFNFSCVLNIRGINWADVAWIAHLGGKRKPVKKRTYKELEHATQGFYFLNRLGHGASGEVHKGILGRRVVAVKARDELKSGVSSSSDQFETELKILKNLEHPNIIRLLGYCKERQKQCLVYEFAHRGSLKDIRSKGTQLKWNARMDVAVGVAEALGYLHNAKPPIVHADLKESVVLLDENFNTKLSGFGISRFDANRASKPERRGEHEPVTKNTAWDIHEFGKLLFQLISGREPVFLINNRVKTIVAWAHELLDKKLDCYDELIDPVLKNVIPKEIVLVAGWVARKCTHENVAERPVIDSLQVEVKMLAESSMRLVPYG